MKAERTPGGYCGCATLIPLPIAYVLVDEEIMAHGMSTSILYSFLFLVVMPIILFHLVKWTVNGFIRVGRRVNQ